MIISKNTLDQVEFFIIFGQICIIIFARIMGSIGGNELGEWRPYNSAIRKRGDVHTTRGEHEKPSETIPEK